MAARLVAVGSLAAAAAIAASGAGQANPAAIGGGAGATDPDRVAVSPSGQRVWVGPGEFRAVRTLLKVEGPMRYGQYRWDDVAPARGPVWVRVDLPRQILSVFRGGDEIGTAVILYGTDSTPTPTGRFPILARQEDHWSRSYDAPMPYTLRLTADGVAIHGSDVLRGRATHGCIGVPIDFARHLFRVTGSGDPVFIVGETSTSPSPHGEQST